MPHIGFGADVYLNRRIAFRLVKLIVFSLVQFLINFYYVECWVVLAVRGDDVLPVLHFPP